MPRNLRIPNSRKIPGPKNCELRGFTVYYNFFFYLIIVFLQFFFLADSHSRWYLGISKVDTYKNDRFARKLSFYDL